MSSSAAVDRDRHVDEKQWRLSSKGDFFLLLREVLGELYGSEDICLLLYTLAKREKVEVAVELGTGMGVTSAWIAAAMRENGFGKIFTYDNGSHYHDHAHVKEVLASLDGPLRGLASLSQSADYASFLQGLFDQADVAQHIAFHQTEIGRPPVLEDLHGKSIDLLFSDFDHSPMMVQKIIGAFLPYMSPTSSIFVDSASTHLPSFYALNNMVSLLQDMRLPKSIAELLSHDEMLAALNLIGRSKFTLTHLVEKRDRAQNSTAWIRIEPVDILPPTSEFFH